MWWWVARDKRGRKRMSGGEGKGGLEWEGKWEGASMPTPGAGWTDGC